MMLFKKKKIEPVAPAPTTEQIMKSAMTRVEKEIHSYNDQKDIALSVFRSTAARLESINEGLQKSVHNLDEMIKFATEQKASVEKNISDNTKVRDKIISIIGE